VFFANIIKGDTCMEDFFGGSRDRIEQVLEEEYEIEETDTVPEIPDLPFRNKGGPIETSVLFADLRGCMHACRGTVIEIQEEQEWKWKKLIN